MNIEKFIGFFLLVLAIVVSIIVGLIKWIVTKN